MLFLGFMIESFGVPRLRPNWSIQIEKSWILVSSTGSLIKGHTKGRPWEAGETVDLRDCWGAISGTYIYLLHLVLLSRPARGRADVSSRPLQAAWPYKVAAEVAILQSSFAETSTFVNNTNWYEIALKIH